MSYRSAFVTLDDALNGGQTLLGAQIPTKMLLRSLDGGASWHPLPPYTLATALDSGYFEDALQGTTLAVSMQAPDGTIYTIFDFPGPTSAPIGIYRLAPGAANWSYVAPPPAGGGAIFVWDNAGHLAAIWGDTGSNTGAGLEYRVF